jgi:hypothetical protein
MVGFVCKICSQKNFLLSRRNEAKMMNNNLQQELSQICIIQQQLQAKIQNLLKDHSLNQIKENYKDLMNNSDFYDVPELERFFNSTVEIHHMIRKINQQNQTIKEQLNRNRLHQINNQR